MKNIKKIVEESIKKVLKETIENNMWEELLDDIDVKYYDDEPQYFIDDFVYYVESVLSDAYKRNRGDENWLDNIYHASPDLMEEYTNLVREKVNADFEQMYEDLKRKQIQANNGLDDCIKMITFYKKGGNPSIPLRVQ